jgi:uncharacterized protein YggU (UPF0235/DUF167 family)
MVLKCLDDGEFPEVRFPPPMAETCEILFRVQPHAKKPGISLYSPGVLKLKVAAQAIEGKANEAMVDFLAGRLDCSPRQITILKGLKSREKRFRIEGFSVERAFSILLKK